MKITLKEARRRTGLKLKSDLNIFLYDYDQNLISVRHSQTRMEKRYPPHKNIRLAAIEYFVKNNYDYYPQGIAVDKTYSCPDFALFRSNKIIFVEVLTEHWVTRKNVNSKARIQQFGPLWLIIEKKPKEDFEKPYQYYNYLKRVHRLSRHFRIYWGQELKSDVIIKRYRKTKV